MNFCHFVKSYEVLQSILRPLIRLLYPRLYLADSGLEFHYTPFTGYPTKVNLPLTHSPEEFCRWLGLDFSVWLAGFEVPVDVWDWILSVDVSSELATALRRVKAGEKPVKGGRPGRSMDSAEIEAWDEFVMWVKEGEFDWEHQPQGGVRGKKTKLLPSTRSVPHARIDLNKPRELDEVARRIIAWYGKEEDLESMSAKVRAEAELSFRSEDVEVAST